MTSPNEFRLPTNVRPERYELALTPDLDDFTFEGVEAVSLDVVEATKTLVLNAAEMTVHEASVTLADGASIEASVAVDEETERATVTLAREAPSGAATLHLRFSGVLNDQMRGFYRSTYEAPDGSTRRMATTQFEATDARRAFPCWDEPAVKAVFDVTLIVPDGLDAVSNMPKASDEPLADGKRTVRFEPTPVMSTYLLVFIVGDIARVEATASNGTVVGVWTTRGKEELGRFALENSVRILDYMNEYFGIDYPLPKMDHIAIPDFAAGAMENWGAITYRETALLFDPGNSAAQARQRILEVVAHEMAHMWFGDLVTMEWWDDLWLNESFASWMGDKAVDHLYPEWQMWTQFVSQDTNTALGLDGLRSSHPIEATVNDPAEIRELFDAISYSKGGAVLRMLEDFLGPETFPQRTARLPLGECVRQREDRAPVDGDGGRVGQARDGDYGHVGQADGLPRDQRRGHTGRFRGRRGYGAAPLPLRPSPRRGARRHSVASAGEREPTGLDRTAIVAHGRAVGVCDARSRRRGRMGEGERRADGLLPRELRR